MNVLLLGFCFLFSLLVFVVCVLLVVIVTSGLARSLRQSWVLDFWLLVWPLVQLGISIL